ncbi:MAG: endonuclease/exonuclease/phosphatase family protein [Acidimicrobiales bacterium]
MFTTIRLATFNIRHGESRAGTLDLPLLYQSCADLNVDVLALQEVDRRMRRTRWVDTSARVGRRSGMARAFGPALRKGRFGRYGNALFVRGTISDVEVLPLPKLHPEPRAGLVATAATGGRSLSIAVTHLSTHLDERDQQLSALLEALGKRPGPRVLCGDLNGPNEDVKALIEAAGYGLVTAGPTFPGSGPTKQIDHVAVAGLDIVNAWVPDIPVSDHRPLVVELAAPPASP